jgi:copper transport protein
MGGTWSRTARQGVVPVLWLGLVALGLGGPAPPAGAHANVVRTSPADGEMVEHTPAQVTIVLDAKPITLEGDPVEVYGPGGDRVDVGTPRANAAGTEITVGLSSAGGRPEGHYNVVYRIISADSHLISGRFSFHSHGPGEPATAALQGTPPAAGQTLHSVAPRDGWLRIGLAMAAGGLIAVAVPRRDRRGRAH